MHRVHQLHIRRAPRGRQQRTSAPCASARPWLHALVRQAARATPQQASFSSACFQRPHPYLYPPRVPPQSLRLSPHHTRCLARRPSPRLPPGQARSLHALQVPRLVPCRPFVLRLLVLTPHSCGTHSRPPPCSPILCSPCSFIPEASPALQEACQSWSLAPLAPPLSPPPQQRCPQPQVSLSGQEPRAWD